MRQDEIETVEVRHALWLSGASAWALREVPDPYGAMIELARDGEVVLRLDDVEVRLLAAAIAKLRDAPAPRAERPKPARARQPWSADDDARLTALHAAGEPPKVIAAALERTTYAIESRLVRLGLVPPQPDGWRGLRAPSEA